MSRTRILKHNRVNDRPRGPLGGSQQAKESRPGLQQANATDRVRRPWPLPRVRPCQRDELARGCVGTVLVVVSWLHQWFPSREARRWPSESVLWTVHQGTLWTPEIYKPVCLRRRQPQREPRVLLAGSRLHTIFECELGVRVQGCDAETTRRLPAILTFLCVPVAQREQVPSTHAHRNTEPLNETCIASAVNTNGNCLIASSADKTRSVNSGAGAVHGPAAAAGTQRCHEHEPARHTRRGLRPRRRCGSATRIRMPPSGASCDRLHCVHRPQGPCHRRLLRRRFWSRDRRRRRIFRESSRLEPDEQDCCGKESAHGWRHVTHASGAPASVAGGTPSRGRRKLFSRRRGLLLWLEGASLRGAG